jgi:hypothetical protein
MKMNFTERLATLLLSAIVLYASVINVSEKSTTQNSTIARKKLQEDSAVILIDKPSVKTKTILLQTSKTK